MRGSTFCCQQHARVVHHRGVQRVRHRDGDGVVPLSDSGRMLRLLGEVDGDPLHQLRVHLLGKMRAR